MKTFFRYFGYRLKDSTLRTIVVSLFSFFYTMSWVNSSIEPANIYNSETGKYDKEVANCYLYFFYILLIVLVYVIPMMELSRFKNRRNLDTLYFFPLSRTKLALVHYLVGILQFLAAYTLSFGVVAFRIIEISLLYQSFLIPCYLGMLFSSLLVYTFVCYLFSSENTVFDGVVTSLWWIALPTLVYLIPQTIHSSLDFGEPSGFWYVLFGPMILFGEVFASCFESGASATGDAIDYFKEEWYMLLIWTALAGLAFFLYLRTFQKKGAEKAGAPSSSPVGLQFLIPAWGYLGFWFVLQLDSVILIFMTILSILIGYFILRRSFKLKKKDLICTALTIFLALTVFFAVPEVERLIERIASEKDPDYTHVTTPNFDEVESPVFLQGCTPKEFGATITRFSSYSDKQGNVDVYMALSFSEKELMMNYLDLLRADAADPNAPYSGLYALSSSLIDGHTTLFSTKYTLDSIATPAAGCILTISRRNDKKCIMECDYGVISYSKETLTVIQSYCYGSFERGAVKDVPVLATNYFPNGYEVSFKE